MPTDPRKAVLWLIVGTGLLRLLWAATLEPTNDEAYHWLYAVRPALSYFDHPPMTAWVELLGLTLCGGWVHPLSLRLGFVLMFAGSTWMLYRWTARWFGGWAGVYAAIGLNLSAYFTAAAGAFALPDGPFLFFALLTYWQASIALIPSPLGEPDQRFGPHPQPLSLGNRPETGRGERGVQTEDQPPPTLSRLAEGEDHRERVAAQRPGEGLLLSPSSLPQARGELANWLLVGVGFAGAMLSKYHAIFLPAGVLAYVLFTPGTRRVLRTPGPYLAVLMGAVGFLPVVLWNAANDWASFKFQGGRAVGLKFRPEGLLAWTFGPVLYLLPGIWFALVREAAPRLRRFGQTAGIERLLVCLSVVPLTFFLMVSCVRWVLLHWNLIGFVPLYVLAGKAWADWNATNPARAKFGLRFMTVSVLLLIAAAWVHIHVGLFRMPGKDPTDDVAGWKGVAEEMETRGLLSDPNKFLITNRWYESGQLAFAVRNRLPAVCYHSLDARGFAFWSKPEDWIGKTGYLVLASNSDDPRSATDPRAPAEADQLLAEFRPFFRSITLVAEFPMRRGRRDWREVRVYECATQLRPYPFSYKGRTEEPGRD